MKLTRFNRFATLATLTILPGILFAVDRNRNATANLLVNDAAWTTIAPSASDRAVWNSLAIGGATTLGGDASWQGILVGSGTPTSGPLFTNVANPSIFTLTLGSGGIDLNNGGNTNRGITFESNTRLNLAANQTWKLGFGSSTAANLVVNSVISGTGSLAVTRDAASSNLLQLSGANTFTGGFTLNSGAIVTIGVASVISGGNTTSSALGAYDGNQFLTINGGRINSGNFSFHARDAKINGDFTFVTTARTDFQGGYDLQNGTRTMTLTRSANAANTVIQGGNVALRFSNASGTSFSNGTLRIAADAAITGANFVPVIAVAGTTFADNAGLTLGPKVVYSAGSGTLNGATTVPSVTLEAGSYWNLAEGAAVRNPQVNSLSGAGTVLAAGNATAGTAYTLTIKGNSGTVSDFSGSVVNSDTTTFSTSTADIVVGVTKQGSTTQIFSGFNSYTGATTISGGKLSISPSGSINGTSGVTIGTASTNAATEFNYNSSTALTQAVSFASESTGGTLSGNGTINQAVSITVGNTLAIGNSLGIMNFGDTLGLGGNTIMEIDGTSGAGLTNGYDFANVSGALTYGGTLTLDLGVSFGIGSYTWNLFDFAGADQGTFATITLADQYSGSLSDGDADGVWFLTSDINAWQFTESTGVLGLTVVPEPQAALLGGLGMLALLRRRRL